MSKNELVAKIEALNEWEAIIADAQAEAEAIRDEIKAEMLAKNTDVLKGRNCMITWKTVVTNRFDSSAFKLTHADLFAQYSRATTTRRFVIA